MPSLDEDAIAITRMAREWLEARGWKCIQPAVMQEMIRVSDFAKMLPFKLTKNAMWRRLNHRLCPNFVSQRGAASGRIVYVVPNSNLIKFCSQPVNGGVPMKSIEELDMEKSLT